MNFLILNFFGFGIEVNCDDEQILQLLKKDFSFFISKEKKTDFVIEATRVKQYSPPVNLKATSQSKNSISYQYDEVKYQDYYGKAWTETYLYKVRLFYFDSKILHELLYLIILSYSGKKMDLMGFHKIHACGVSYKGTNLVLMMPSKGGKTTLFMDLIMNPEVSIISDDTPVITRWGNLKPFPLRVGSETTNDIKKRFPYIRDESFYSLDRVHYSKKYLLSLNELKNKVSVGNKKSIFIAGYRSTREEPKLVELSKFRFLKELIKHMVVGIGLPLVIEHFFRLGVRDFFANISIFLSRLLTGIVMICRHQAYLIEFSSDRMKNRKLVMDLLDEKDMQ